MKPTKQLCLCFLLLTMSAVDVSSYDFKSGGICYNVIRTTDGNKAAEVTWNDEGYYSGEIVIPESVFYDGQILPVTRIGNAAFCAYHDIQPTGENTGEMAKQGGHDLSAVTIPSSVTEIGDKAFLYCTGLCSISLGEGICDIGADAFFSCESLKKVVLPSSVRKIGQYAFSSCSSLTDLVLNEGLVSIQGSAFAFCSALTSINIPSTVRELDASSFTGCTSLFSVTILTPECGDWFRGAGHIREVTLGECVTRIADAAFKNCTNLESITATDYLSEIGQKALDGTAWLETQPEGLIYLGRTLYCCKGELPEKSKVEIQEGTVSICDNAFDGCSNLFAVSIPSSVKLIGDAAFAGCINLCDIYLPSTVESIGVFAFRGCSSLESVVLPSDITTLPMGLFMNCSSLKNIALPLELTRIEPAVFKNCSGLESVALSAPLGAIGKEAFAGCTNLKSVILPATVTEIDQEVFYEDCQLSAVISLMENPCYVHRSVFGMTGSQEGATLYIPSDTKAAYISAGWNRGFRNIIEREVTELITSVTHNAINSNLSNSNCYDLSGRRTAPPKKGVYIENGKIQVTR